VHQAEQVAELAANLAQRIELQILGSPTGLDVGT
jgi:hypothetical protein